MTIAEFISKYNHASNGVFKAGQTNGISSEDMRELVTDITSLTDIPITAASANLNTDSADTTGATITLDFDSGSDYIFVGSASFATAKTIALSNDTNALRFAFHFQITNVAAVLEFPSSFTMSDARWNDSDHEWTSLDIGKFKAKAEFDGSDWNLEIFGPYP